MVEDIRVQRRRVRRLTVTLLWFFLAVPCFLGILLLVRSGYQSMLGWVIAVIFVGSTIFLGYAFVNADKLPVSGRSSGGGRYGMPRE